jgi:sulfane dehydrogenase subunit SoxC
MASGRSSVPEAVLDRGVSRRQFLTAGSTSVAGVTLAGSALAETLAEVPARGPGAPFGSVVARLRSIEIAAFTQQLPNKRASARATGERHLASRTGGSRIP